MIEVSPRTRILAHALKSLHWEAPTTEAELADQLGQTADFAREVLIELQARRMVKRLAGGAWCKCPVE